MDATAVLRSYCDRNMCVCICGVLLVLACCVRIEPHTLLSVWLWVCVGCANFPISINFAIFRIGNQFCSWLGGQPKRRDEE